MCLPHYDAAIKLKFIIYCVIYEFDENWTAHNGGIERNGFVYGGIWNDLTVWRITNDAAFMLPMADFWIMFLNGRQLAFLCLNVHKNLCRSMVNLLKYPLSIPKSTAQAYAIFTLIHKHIFYDKIRLPQLPYQHYPKTIEILHKNFSFKHKS